MDHSAGKLVYPSGTEGANEPVVDGPVAITGQIEAPEPSPLFSAEELANLTGGIWTGAVPSGPIDYVRHRLDHTEEGLRNFLYVPELFARAGGTTAHVALLTCPEAMERGAAACLVTARPRNIDTHSPCLIVTDPSEAVAAIARRQRSKSAARFVAVTGSIGKSTTKNMIHSLLAASGPATRSIYNYNAGKESADFTLANLSLEHRYCVAEFSEVGGIEAQTAVYRPHVAVITNIEWEHVSRLEAQGYFGDALTDRLVHLVCALVRHLDQGGQVVLDRDHANYTRVVDEAAKTNHSQIVTYGMHPESRIRLLAQELDEAGSWLTIEAGSHRHRFRVGIPGAHMARNALAAVAAAHALDIDLEPAIERLADFRPDSRRGVRYRLPWAGGSLEVLDESVSGNLPGMASIFASLHQQPRSGRKIAVLGEIGELGVNMPKDMAMLARAAAGFDIDRFFTIGEDMAVFNRSFPDRGRIAPHAQTLEHLEAQLLDALMPGDIVGFKGSRRPERIALRRILARLAQAKSKQTSPAVDALPVRVVVGGDTYLGESYQVQREKRGELNYLRAFGYDYSLEAVAELTRRADCSVINLECALTQEAKSEHEGVKSFILKGDPGSTIAALKAINVHGAMLANNHSKDYGDRGLRDTIAHLEKADIAAFGAGEDKLSAQRPFLREFLVGNTRFRIAIISAYEYNDFHESLKFYSGFDRPGVNNLNFDRITAQIAALKSTGHYVIVSPHWGENYCLRNYDQSRLAKRLVNAGADLILGHGPHVLNEIEQIDDIWVAHSLGNFVFNSEGEYERRALLPFSFIAEMELRPRPAGVSGMLNLYPIVSCNQMTQFRPVFADDRQFSRLIQALRGLHYDPDLFSTSVEARKVDGRNCLTVRLF